MYQMERRYVDFMNVKIVERAFLEQVGEANLTALAYGQEPYQPHDDEKDCQKVEKVFDGTSQVLHNFCL